MCATAKYAPLSSSLRREQCCRKACHAACVIFAIVIVAALGWLGPWSAHAPATWADACGSAAATERLAACNTSGATQRVQLWGERHSGTNALERLIRRNFRVDGSMSGYGFKHMLFMTNRSEDMAFWRKQLALSARRRPTVVATREPIRWLLSMHERPHHLPWLRGLPLDAFVKRAWLTRPPASRVEEARCSELLVSDEVEHADCDQAPNLPAFKNIIEMRTAKLRLLWQEVLRPTGRRVLAVRQEDFGADGGVRVACRLLAELRLCPKGERVQPVLGKATPGGGYWPFWRWAFERKSAISTNAEIDAELGRWVCRQLDWELEEFFGYSMPPYRK